MDIDILGAVDRSWARHGYAGGVAADLGISVDSVWALMADIEANENAGV